MKIFGFEINRAKKISANTQNIVPSAISLFPNNTTEKSIEIKNDLGSDYPVHGGRTSYPSSVNLLTFLGQQYALVSPNFPAQLLPLLKNLAFWNYDVSNAVFNVATMANTKFRYKFPDTILEKDSKKYREFLNIRRNQYYKGGIHSLNRDLFTQLATSGTVSAEIVPKNNLSGVDSVVMVAVEQIGFYYSGEEGKFIPYQHLVSTNGNGYASQSGTENKTLPIGAIELNRTTYQYIPIQLFDNSPFAVPPLAAALQHIELDSFLISNMRHAFKKLGMMGFLEILLTAPLRNQNENDEDYWGRCNERLKQAEEQAQRGLASGIGIGFKDNSEFKLHQTISDASGAKDLIELNDQRKSTGLKQDGMLAGRPAQTVSEATAKVILSKLSMQLGSYQMAVAHFLAELFRIDLALNGFGNVQLEVVFDEANVTDDLKSEQAKQLKILNAINMRDQNIISQTQAANLLGIDVPFGDKPIVAEPAKPEPYVNTTNEIRKKASDKDVKDASSEKHELNAIFQHLRADLPQFEYLSQEYATGDNTVLRLSESLSSELDGNSKNDLDNDSDFDGDIADSDEEKKLKRAYNKYAKLIYALFLMSLRRAVTKSIDRISLNTDLTEDEFVIRVKVSIYSTFQNYFASETRNTANDFINSAYLKFRQDKNKGALTKNDRALIEWFKKIDSFYLAKFMTDLDTQKAIDTFIRQFYLDNGIDFNDTKTVSTFRRGLTELLNNQDWKIARILSTSISRIRNTAAVMFMQQNGIQEFEIRGVNDSKQCAYCHNLQGYRFSVSGAIDKIMSASQVEPTHTNFLPPFITSLFSSPDQMIGLSNKQMFDKGVSFPPFHCHCRDIAIPI